jgi:hypothetical protein
MPALPIQQADLILKLYELRRETVMRELLRRRRVPSLLGRLVAIVTGGGRQGGFVLQVFGYWDMVAAFVHHGALDASLVYDTCQEMYFQYAKIQPYLRDFRRRMNLPEWMISLERLIEGSKPGRKRLAVMRKNLDAMAKLRAPQNSQAAKDEKP